jgi:hypothetical protein
VKGTYVSCWRGAGGSAAGSDSRSVTVRRIDLFSGLPVALAERSMCRPGWLA